MACSRLRLVAAMMRTLTRTVLVAADALEAALLQHAQQAHLHGGADVADLVEEERAAVGQLEAALALLHAPVKAPFSWPNSSLSIRFSGSAAQLTLMNGPVARRC
jgi:hypothetical protein